VIYTCPGDGNADTVEFISMGASEDTDYQFVVTDADFNIIGVPPGNTINAEGAGEGTCYVWGFAYTGELLVEAGMNVFQTQVSTGCWNLSKNALKVVRDTPDGGMVALSNGSTEKTICTSDGYDNVAVYTNTSESTSAFQYVVTDEENNILAVLDGTSQNFEGVPPGTCRVWGLSYTGNLIAEAGANAAAVALSDGCFDLSDNFITVVRTDVDGGTVTTADGTTNVSIVAGDGIADRITLNNTATQNANFSYVITDENNTVLAVPNGNSVDFEGAGAGVCLIWGVSYTGDLKYLIGGDLFGFALSTDCFDISMEAVTVTRTTGGGDTAINGGTVAMPSGATEKYTCANDGVEDVIRVVSTWASTDANYTLVVTDQAGTILGVPPADMVNVTGAGTGVCLVWGLAYTGELTAQMGDNAMDVALSSGEFALSDNFITLNRDEANGGTVTTTSGATEVTIVAGDGMADNIEFMSEGTSNSNFTYVITDENATILGIPSGNSQDFEGAGAGVCLVWGLSYTGEITAQMGDNAAEIALTDECFDLSDNFIRVNRTAASPYIQQFATIANSNNLDATVSPNPTTDLLELNISNQISTSPTQIVVLDVLGKVVLEQTFDPSVAHQNTFELDVQQLIAGTYFVQIRSKEERRTLPFVKK
ncbi:MAG: T9SS type A sorting domain-containing protein, partial [Bacteroidota bacterium]